MFTSARIRLTAWYLVMLMTVSVLFSVVVFRLTVMEVVRFETMQRIRSEERWEKLYRPLGRGELKKLPVSMELIEETKHRIGFFLLVVNFGILFCGGGLSYILAGKTLVPILQMLESQKQFVGDISHELKTPLTSLRISNELALRRPDFTAFDTRALIGENVREIDELHNLIDTLMNMNKLEYEQVTDPLLECSSLNEIVSKTVHALDVQARSKPLSIVSNIPVCMVKGDAFLLTKLCTILLDNAIKYSPPSSTITLGARLYKNSATLSIADQGNGIDPKDMPHIFTRFYKGSAGRTRSEDSSSFGLGLAIAQKIASLHNTRIAVKSELGKGSTFSITLRLAKPSA
ncbi:MAG: HAMP domain-containing sensor histidine kinase [bacterium]